jgi:hypothetical protein
MPSPNPRLLDVEVVQWMQDCQESSQAMIKLLIENAAKASQLTELRQKLQDVQRSLHSTQQALLLKTKECVQGDREG